jgi:hypothetical protein
MDQFWRSVPHGVTVNFNRRVFLSGGVGHEAASVLKVSLQCFQLSSNIGG